MYKVIKYFTDLQDNGHAYNVGDVFPHEGMKVSKKRLEELASPNNKQGVPLIAEEKEEPAVAEEAKAEEAKAETKPKRGRKKA